jgi:hypothetical protein
VFVQAEAQQVESVDAINAWAERVTKGLIKTAVPPGTPFDMVLTNAVYFKVSGAYACNSSVWARVAVLKYMDSIVPGRGAQALKVACCKQQLKGACLAVLWQCVQLHAYLCTSMLNSSASRSTHMHAWLRLRAYAGAVGAFLQQRQHITGAICP